MINFSGQKIVIFCPLYIYALAKRAKIWYYRIGETQ